MDFNPLVRERLVRNYQRSGAKFVLTAIIICLLCLCIRMGYIMIVKADYYGEKAQNLHERERSVKAKRGVLYDRNNKVIAGNESVSTISVIHSQIDKPEEVIKMLCDNLDMDEAAVRKKVEKVSSIETIKTNVDKDTGDIIRKAEQAPSPPRVSGRRCGPLFDPKAPRGQNPPQRRESSCCGNPCAAGSTHTTGIPARRISPPRSVNSPCGGPSVRRASSHNGNPRAAEIPIPAQRGFPTRWE